MQKTWKPQIAGVLSIVGGAVALFGSLGILIAMIALGITGDWARDWGFGWLPLNVISILWVVGVPLFICGVIAITGGIFAIVRKAWGMALAGSIAALFPVWILGLGSIVLIATSRDEFGKQEKPVIVAEKTN